jgi:hypothetical protein
MIAWAIAECLRPGGHYREQALIIDIEGESGEASGDPPSLWLGSGVTSPPICALARLRRDLR